MLKIELIKRLPEVGVSKDKAEKYKYKKNSIFTTCSVDTIANEFLRQNEK